MSKFKKLRFCDKCLQSIPTGDIYYEKGQKDYCSKCNKKGGWFRSIAMLLVFAVCFLGGYQGYTDTHDRIDANQVAIEKTANYVYKLNMKLANTFANLDRWAQSVETRLESFYAEHKNEAKMLAGVLAGLREETAAIREAQDALRKELNGGKLTDEKVGAAITALQARSKLLEDQMQVVLRNPQELVEKVIKPTVAIGVRDTKGDHLRGSGVLFKRVEEKDSKGRRVYRYYGFTCYHVWEGVFQYLEKIKQPDPPPIVLPDGRVIIPPKIDRKLNPKLLVKFFDGNSERAQVLFVGGKFIFPTKAIGSFKPLQDIAVFTFRSERKLPVAEMASDEEIRANVRYGSRIYAAGIAMLGVPSVYFGTVANPKLPGEHGISFQTYGYFGQSGGPIFDAKTLKIISLNQRIHGHRLMIGSTPVTNLLFGTLMTEIRKVWRVAAPKEYRKILDGK